MEFASEEGYGNIKIISKEKPIKIGEKFLRFVHFSNGSIAIGNGELLQHWELTGQSRESAQNTDYLNVGIMHRLEKDGTPVWQVWAGSGALKVQGREVNESARGFSLEELIELERLTCDFLTEVYKDTNFKYAFVSARGGLKPN